jgi:hypothetical protein
MDQTSGFMKKSARNGIDPTLLFRGRGRCFRRRFVFQHAERDRFGHRKWGVRAQLRCSLSTGHTDCYESVVDREERAGKQFAVELYFKCHIGGVSRCHLVIPKSSIAGWRSILADLLSVEPAHRLERPIYGADPNSSKADRESTVAGD